MVIGQHLKGVLEELRALGVKRVVFETGDMSRPREVEFFEASPTEAEATETIELELPEDDGVPMVIKDAANVLMAKKKGAS